MTTDHQPVIRARQRSRTSLRAFTPALQPQLHEVMIDRFQLRVNGTWIRLGGGNAPGRRDAVEDILSWPDEVDWFCVPTSEHGDRVMDLRKNARCTISDLRVRVTATGKIRVSVTSNPSRTLAHLMAQYPEEHDLGTVAAQISPFEFFAMSQNPVAAGFGRKTDNWISDMDRARSFYDQGVRSADRDVAVGFLPIFLTQLQALVALLFSPDCQEAIPGHQGDVVIAGSHLERRLHWGTANLPQVESYFERHHFGAVSAMRIPVMAALGELDEAVAARYSVPTSDWVERQDDCLTVSTALSRNRRLVVYAKSRSRIRFEVQRTGKGDYTGVPSAVLPIDRPLAILHQERRRLLDATRWEWWGRAFEEPPRPSLEDLTQLCALIASICADCDVAPEPVLARLFQDGALTSGRGGQAPPKLIRGLQKVGVVQRVHVLIRDHRHPVKRYALLPHYRGLVERLTAALV